jgi:hypothetical protein
MRSGITLPIWSPRAVLTMACLVLPWVNPAAWGPSPAVVPWLVSAACAVMLSGLFTWNEPYGVSRLTEQSHAIATGWLVAALISSVIALCQYFDFEHHFAHLMNTAPPGDAFANLRQRNQFATLATIGMASLLWWTSRGLASGYALPAMALLAVANAASASRTGLLQMLMLTVFLAIWPPGPHRGKQVGLCLLGLVAYLAASFLLPQLLEALAGVTAINIWGRLASGQDCSSRVALWSNVLHLIAQKPWLGWGWGELDYAHYMTLYDDVRFCDILDNAHNLPLHLAVELGVPVASLVCGAFLWWVVRAKPWSETEPTRQLAWSGLAVILLHSMLEYPLWYGPFQLAFVLCLVLLRDPRHSRRASSAPPATWAASGRRMLALGLMSALAFAAWDYRRVSQIYLPQEARDAEYREATLARIGRSWLFRDHLRFAELTITPLSRGNAEWIFAESLAMLHFSPEPRVIEKLIESAVLLGRDEEAQAHLARFRAAFPGEHARSAAVHAAPPVQRSPGVGQEGLKD